MGGSKTMGCMITSDDKSRVMASFSIYFAILARGICVGMLAAAIPILSEVVGVVATRFGEVFSARGVGYMAGTLLSAAFLHLPNVNFSKHGATCLAIIFSGICTLCFAFTSSFVGMLILSAGQGFGFGVMHTYATIALLEMWGQRAQLWLQVKPSALGMGGAIGPVLVSWLGYQDAFIASAGVCSSCLVIYAIAYFFSRTHRLARWGAKRLHLRESSKKKHQSHSLSTSQPTGPGQSCVSQAVPVSYGSLPPPVTHRTDSHTSMSRCDEGRGGGRDMDLSPSMPDLYFSSDLRAMQSALCEEVRRLSISFDHEKDTQFVDNGITIADEALGPFAYQSFPSLSGEGMGGGTGISESHPLLPTTTVTATEREGTYGHSETLAFATPSMVSHIEEIETHAHHRPLGVTLIPMQFQYYLCVFLFMCYGIFYSYGGWITSYSMMTGLAATEADASYLTSVFFMWVTVGSVLSVPLAVLASTTTLLRLQLGVVGAGVTVLITVGIRSYQWLAVASALTGYGVSCIFPLVVCLGSEYDFTMDSQSTALLIMSGTVGESLVPVMVGQAMGMFGASLFPSCMVLLTLVMIASYALAHTVALRLAGQPMKQFKGAVSRECGH